jgi:glyoxylase-like metal-dependent hydrolase (beta-lactamase superfamily II)
MKLTSLGYFAAIIAVVIIAGSFAVWPQGSAGLKSLELSTDLSPVIRYAPQFSPGVREYSVTVDSTNVKAIRINPIPASSGDQISINGVSLESGKSHNADLKGGENRFEIAVKPANGNSVQYILTIIQKDLSDQYKTDFIQKGIWRISDHAGFPPNQDMYLIEGKSKGVLIDTGMGKGDLAGLVKGLTTLPVEVAITHGHGDHVGQISQFDGAVIYMSEKDKGFIPKTLDTGKFVWVKDGDRIDLGGGQTLEAIEVPGHSAGSLMFLDRAGKTLAVGDAIGSGMGAWLFIPGTPSLAEYRDTLKRLEKRLAGLDSLTFLTGHHWQEKTPQVGTAGKQLVTDLRILCEKILSAEIKGTPGKADIGGRKIDVLIAEYGLAGIWYNPDNIVGAKPAADVQVPGQAKVAEKGSAGTVPVTFLFDAGKGSSATIYLAGSFNGWSATKNLMSDPDGDGIYEITMHLPPASYQYKFVKNGSWITDTNAKEFAIDGFGGKNSMLTVPATATEKGLVVGMYTTLPEKFGGMAAPPNKQEK